MFQLIDLAEACSLDIWSPNIRNSMKEKVEACCEKIKNNKVDENDAKRLQEFLYTLYSAVENGQIAENFKNVGMIKLIREIFDNILPEATDDYRENEVKQSIEEQLLDIIGLYWQNQLSLWDTLSLVIHLSVVHQLLLVIATPPKAFAELLPGGRDEIITEFCPKCLDLILKTHHSYHHEIEIIKGVNMILENCSFVLKEELIQHMKVKEKLKKIAGKLKFAGDYEFQVGILECLFRMIPWKQRTSFAKEVFDDQNIEQQFAAIHDAKFETDCRIFLNKFNSQMREPLIVSIPCSSAFLGNKELIKPQDEDYASFWVDFNFRTNRLTLFCEQIASSQKENDFWDTVAVEQNNIDKVEVQERKDENVLVITFVKSISVLYPSQNVIGNQLQIHFQPFHDIDKILAKTFKDICSSAQISQGSQKVSSAVIPVHIDKEDVNVLENQESWRSFLQETVKVSSPTTPMCLTSNPTVRKCDDTYLKHAANLKREKCLIPNTSREKSDTASLSSVSTKASKSATPLKIVSEGFSSSFNQVKKIVDQKSTPKQQGMSKNKKMKTPVVIITPLCMSEKPNVREKKNKQMTKTKNDKATQVKKNKEMENSTDISHENSSKCSNTVTVGKTAEKNENQELEKCQKKPQMSKKDDFKSKNIGNINPKQGTFDLLQKNTTKIVSVDKTPNNSISEKEYESDNLEINNCKSMSKDFHCKKYTVENIRSKINFSELKENENSNKKLTFENGSVTAPCTKLNKTSSKQEKTASWDEVLNNQVYIEPDDHNPFRKLEVSKGNQVIKHNSMNVDKYDFEPYEIPDSFSSLESSCPVLENKIPECYKFDRNNTEKYSSKLVDKADSSALDEEEKLVGNFSYTSLPALKTCQKEVKNQKEEKTVGRKTKSKNAEKKKVQSHKKTKNKNAEKKNLLSPSKTRICTKIQSMLMKKHEKSQTEENGMVLSDHNVKQKDDMEPYKIPVSLSCVNKDTQPVKGPGYKENIGAGVQNMSYCLSRSDLQNETSNDTDHYNGDTLHGSVVKCNQKKKDLKIGKRVVNSRQKLEKNKKGKGDNEIYKPERGKILKNIEQIDEDIQLFAIPDSFSNSAVKLKSCDSNKNYVSNMTDNSVEENCRSSMKQSSHFQEMQDLSLRKKLFISKGQLTNTLSMDSEEILSNSGDNSDILEMEKSPWQQILNPANSKVKVNSNKFFHYGCGYGKVKNKFFKSQEYVDSSGDSIKIPNSPKCNMRKTVSVHMSYSSKCYKSQNDGVDFDPYSFSENGSEYSVDRQSEEKTCSYRNASKSAKLKLEKGGTVSKRNSIMFERSESFSKKEKSTKFRKKDNYVEPPTTFSRKYKPVDENRYTRKSVELISPSTHSSISNASNRSFGNDSLDSSPDLVDNQLRKSESHSKKEKSVKARKKGNYEMPPISFPKKVQKRCQRKPCEHISPSSSVSNESNRFLDSDSPHPSPDQQIELQKSYGSILKRVENSLKLNERFEKEDKGDGSYECSVSSKVLSDFQKRCQKLMMDASWEEEPTVSEKSFACTLESEMTEAQDMKPNEEESRICTEDICKVNEDNVHLVPYDDNNKRRNPHFSEDKRKSLKRKGDDLDDETTSISSSFTESVLSQENLNEISAHANAFGRHIQNQIEGRKKHLDENVNIYLKKIMNKHMNCTKHLQNYRSKYIGDFQDTIKEEITCMENDIQVLRKKEDDCMAFLKEKLMDIKEYNVRQIKRIKTMNSAKDVFVDKMQECDDENNKTEWQLKESMRKEIIAMHDRIVLEKQKQELTNIKKCLQSSLYSRLM